MNLKFTKMHGLGNDFIVIDNMLGNIRLSAGQICMLADRHTGIGCDQLLLVEAPRTDGVDIAYRIYNADGSEAGQCGNGARCVGRFALDNGITGKREIIAETLGGKVRLIMETDGSVRVNMGIPVFEPERIPLRADRMDESYQLTIADTALEFSALSMGNPHAVLKVPDVATAAVAVNGPLVQQSGLFPEGVNVGFMQVLDPSHIRLRVYERGAGETLACGTGSCAAVVAGIRRGWLSASTTVSLPRGDLQIQWQGPGTEVWMQGPAVTVFEGHISL